MRDTGHPHLWCRLRWRKVEFGRHHRDEPLEICRSGVQQLRTTLGRAFCVVSAHAECAKILASRVSVAGAPGAGAGAGTLLPLEAAAALLRAFFGFLGLSLMLGWRRSMARGTSRFTLCLLHSHLSAARGPKVVAGHPKTNGVASH